MLISGGTKRGVNYWGHLLLEGVPSILPLVGKTIYKRIISNIFSEIFRVKIDSILYWKSRINTIAAKLNGAYTMVYEVRYLKDFVNANILKSIYHALFEFHFNYACIMGAEQDN